MWKVNHISLLVETWSKNYFELFLIKALNTNFIFNFTFYLSRAGPPIVLQTHLTSFFSELKRTNCNCNQITVVSFASSAIFGSSVGKIMPSIELTSLLVMFMSVIEINVGVWEDWPHFINESKTVTPKRMLDILIFVNSLHFASQVHTLKCR